MRRRKFVGGLAGAAAWSTVVRAQQPERVRRIGIFIGIANDAEGQARAVAFREGLQALGWSAERNVQFDERFAAGDVQDMQRYAKELVGLAPDVILVATNPALAALRRETQTIPIVFAQVADPVGAGFVASAAKPGGNITGFSHIEYAIIGKWLELLKVIDTRLTRVAVLGNPTDFFWPSFLRYIAELSPSLGFQVVPTGVHNAGEIERAINAFASEPNGGLVNLPNPITAVNRALIFRLAIRHRLPSMYHLRFFAAEGGLMSYGVNNIDLFRDAAGYVDRILKGEKPGDLSIQFPTKYQLVINLKTAKALGLTVPQSLLSAADEVIE